MLNRGGAGSKFQAQLALYGAIDQAVERSDDPALARSIVEKFLPGTTGFGQRGWYRDVRGFLDELTDGGRAELPNLEAARSELVDAARSDDGLPATVMARAILAEVVLENIDRAGGGTVPSAGGALSEILSVAPAPGTEAGSESSGTVGEEVGAELAERIQADVTDLRGFRAFMNAQSDETISAAVASYEPTAFLRKVRGEYCSVITTDASWTDITFDELLAVVDPRNWDEFYQQFFCAMTPQGETAQGWNAVLEEVSGDCGQYRLTTPLKFWKQLRKDDLFLNYDLDEGNTAEVDRMVLVDSGYLWITREGPGVRVRTSKELLVRGLSSTATTALAGGLGWADNASGMFRYGAKNPPAKPEPFTNSAPKLAAKVPPSTPFPIDPPVLPPDIRVEGVDDTVDEMKKSITALTGFGNEFAARWSNGIDEDDVKFLGARLGAIVGECSASFFDTASSNFRPAPIPKSTV